MVVVYVVLVVVRGKEIEVGDEIIVAGSALVDKMANLCMGGTFIVPNVSFGDIFAGCLKKMWD